MKTIRTAIFGTGFMGRVHLVALRRVEFVEAVAVAGRTAASAAKLGAGFAIPLATDDWRAILRDKAIDAVHVCTPNGLHFEMAKEAVAAGKHLMCEKPLATTVAEAEELVALAKRQGVRHGVCHNIRFYPMVQQIRAMREAGELGEILVVQGSYFQDWLLYETDWNWRVDSKAGGGSRVMADVGSHWFDLAEHLTGLRVTSLCADLQTFHTKRKKPKHAIETFSDKVFGPDDYADAPVDTEDFGALIFRMGERARGSFTASQVSAGRKNRLSIEICGTKSSLAWDQEQPDGLWMGRRNEANQVFVKDPSLLRTGARGYADLPGGHSEGYDDTFKQIFRRFYASIREPGAAAQYPQFEDGLRQLRIVDAAFESNRTRGWVDVPA